MVSIYVCFSVPILAINKFLDIFILKKPLRPMSIGNDADVGRLVGTIGNKHACQLSRRVLIALLTLRMGCALLSIPLYFSVSLVNACGRLWCVDSI